MPDLCFYAPWIMKEPIPDPFRMMLEKAGKKRISYDEADCSMRNIRKQGKVSRLHGPTLHALLTLIQIRKEKDSGAAGIQRGRDTINYFCMEYPGNQGKYVMTYNSKNGRFSGILKTEEKNEKLPGIREGKNTGEQYLALLAYANLVPDNPLFNEEFQKNFYILEEQEKKEWEDTEAALRAAFICCDAMYCEVIANPQQAVPLEKSQFRAEELEDVLPEYKIAAGVYAPNDEIYGKFHVLLPVNEKTKRTLFELKQIYSGRWDVNERTKERIYRTRDLQLRHKEAVLKIEEMKRGIRRRELEEKYVGFQKHLIDLKEKYEFSDGEYQVIAPKSIDDILYEGDTLHHCVNKTDTYFDRIVSKESYILFLREKENPKVPFYTLEVEPDGTIRQKRAKFNRQNKDIDKVTSFLTLWQKEIQKRLTKKDRKSTEESRKLRQQNYQEIRDKHVVVHGGAFAGELLADLLEKDLMDLPVESAENGESPTEIAA